MLIALIVSSCSKNGTVNIQHPFQLPAGAITNTTLPCGNVKGVMLTDSTYQMNCDITVLAGDTLTIQPGATINVNGNHAFYIQGIIISEGTQAKPILFTTPTRLPGDWGGF